MCLTSERVTIEFVAGPWGSPGPEPDAWPPYNTDIRLVQSQAGEPRRFTLYGGEGEAYRLTDEETEHLLDRLARLEVSAPWRPTFGFDGTDCVLRLRAAMSSMTFRWWVKAPPEWERVGEVFDYVMRIARGGSGSMGNPDE